MVFDLNENQKRILMYLYNHRDKPHSPPDFSLTISRVAESLRLKQRDVRDEIEGLVKRLYVSNFTYEGYGYCRIMPRGIKEIERDEKKTTEWEVSTDKIGVSGKKEEDK